MDVGCVKVKLMLCTKLLGGATRGIALERILFHMNSGNVFIQVQLGRTLLGASRGAALERPLFLVNYRNMSVQVLLRSKLLQATFLFANVQPFFFVHNLDVLPEILCRPECFGAIWLVTWIHLLFSFNTDSLALVSFHLGTIHNFLGVRFLLGLLHSFTIL